MTQRQLSRLCQEWQRRLSLQDWQIEVSFARRNVVDGDGVTNYNRSLGRAVIRICDAESFTSRYETYDPEEILVHELLHLEFHFVGDAYSEGEEKFAYERAIDRTAYALVRAKRGEG